MRGPSARRWAPVCGLRRVAQACQLVGFALVHELSRWLMGGSGPTSRHGAAAPSRHHWPLLPSRQSHPQLLEKFVSFHEKNRHSQHNSQLAHTKHDCTWTQDIYELEYTPSCSYVLPFHLISGLRPLLRSPPYYVFELPLITNGNGVVIQLTLHNKRE